MVVDERRAALLRLLQHRDDHLPLPVVRPLSELGFMHRSRARWSCPDCLTNGFASRDCETCKGRGFLEGYQSRDPYDTGRSLGFGRAKHEAAHARDREIEMLEEQVAEPRSEADIAAAILPAVWELERGKAWALFDFGLLDLALDGLRLADDDAYRAVHAVHVYGWQLSPSAFEQAALDRGLGFLLERLPEVIRAPKAEEDPELVAPLDRDVRDGEICRLLDAGEPPFMVAGRFELSVSQVNRIAARHRTAA